MTLTDLKIDHCTNYWYVTNNIRKDYRGYVNEMAECAQNAADKGNMKELYDTLRKIVNAPVSRNVLVKEKMVRL
jgi:hypothetical protein